MPRFALHLIFILALVTPATAQQRSQDPAKNLRAVESELKRSQEKRRNLKKAQQTLKGNLRKLKADLVTTAGKIQNRENAADELERRIAELGGKESELRAHLKEKRAQFAITIAALQRISRLPPEAMVAVGSHPADTVRGAILLRSVLPRIEQEARDLRRSLARLDRVRMDSASQRGLLADELESLENDRRKLARLVAKNKKRASKLARKSRREIQKNKRLANRAKGLQDLLKGIERNRRAQRAQSDKPRKPEPKVKQAVKKVAAKPNQKPIKLSRGKLQYPVSGRIVERYGQATGDGLTSKGIKIASRPRAQVIAPFGGRVVFAGVFRRYGQLLIIEHGEGYHSLFAGLARIDSVIGQRVLLGEPVGVMGDADAVNRSLYLEFRRTGQPINPLPWMAARGGRTSG